jgi:hypothetical protein
MSARVFIGFVLASMVEVSDIVQNPGQSEPFKWCSRLRVRGARHGNDLELHFARQRPNQILESRWQMACISWQIACFIFDGK